MDEHLPRTHGQQAHHGLEEGRFPGPVRPHHRYLSAVGYHQRHRVECEPVAVGDGDVPHLEEIGHCKASTMRVTFQRIMSM